MHHSPGQDCFARGVGNSPPQAYPPSPVHCQVLVGGNDRPPRSPLRRKECIQRSTCMGAVPVLGPLPSLSLRGLK
jgi:hypothetical protein